MGFFFSACLSPFNSYCVCQFGHALHLSVPCCVTWNWRAAVYITLPMRIWVHWCQWMRTTGWWNVGGREAWGWTSPLWGICLVSLEFLKIPSELSTCFALLASSEQTLDSCPAWGGDGDRILGQILPSPPGPVHSLSIGTAGACSRVRGKYPKVASSCFLCWIQHWPAGCLFCHRIRLGCPGSAPASGLEVAVVAAGALICPPKRESILAATVTFRMGAFLTLFLGQIQPVQKWANNPCLSRCHHQQAGPDSCPLLAHPSPKSTKGPTISPSRAIYHSYFDLAMQSHTWLKVRWGRAISLRPSGFCLAPSAAWPHLPSRIKPFKSKPDGRGHISTLLFSTTAPSALCTCLPSQHGLYTSVSVEYENLCLQDLVSPKGSPCFCDHLSHTVGT